jgi:2-keto-4-pentenoate hydratase/2-oxohepta-3-ene-1,7-dioic acid hydratase in catechol pathway
MKLITFRTADEARFGAWHDGLCWDLAAAAELSDEGPLFAPRSVKELLAGGAAALAQARELLHLAAGAHDPLGCGLAYEPAAVELLPPVPDPQKIIAIGLNYRDHCREQNVPEPTVITMFCKFPSAALGAGAPIVLPPPHVSAQVDYEAELALVIGRRGVNIAESEALSYVAGYTCCNDVSARDVQYGDGGKQWVHGKSFDTFAPLGPWLVTSDELPDPHGLDIRCVLNGQVMQASNTSNLVFRVERLVSELSQALTLMPGDVITTGTPGGVGVWRQPQVFLQPGDRVTIAIEGIGELTNPVVAS